ncbi:hypothetical protein JOQ06_005941, partial [Pogonophryne albipinna]
MTPNIKHIPLSRFLSHDQTKPDLTDYLAAKILEYNRGSSKLIITAESDKLPPTLGALKQHILRVHVQTRVWAQAAITLQDPQPDPLHNGYFRDSDGMKPTTTEVLTAPKAVIEMCSSQCQNDNDSHAVMDESDGPWCDYRQTSHLEGGERPQQLVSQPWEKSRGGKNGKEKGISAIGGG